MCRGAAERCGIGGRDFIVLEADPPEDITNTRRIVSVYVRGEPIDRE